jgi:hypothetical protein
MKTRIALLVALAFIVWGTPMSRANEKQTAADLRAEGLGALRLGMREKEVRAFLGAPAKQTALTLQGADGLCVQEWNYPAKGISLTMSTGETKKGPKTVVRFEAAAPCQLATRRGIKIGSAESAVRKAYAAMADRETPAAPGSFIAGSIFGGIIFNFSGGKVSHILFGAGAE